MTQIEASQNALAGILDRLGPGLFLEVDDAWLSRAFNFRAAGSNAGPLKMAENFAQDRQCCFLFDQKTGGGKFGRAYFGDPSN